MGLRLVTVTGTKGTPEDADCGTGIKYLKISRASFPALLMNVGIYNLKVAVIAVKYLNLGIIEGNIFALQSGDKRNIRSGFTAPLNLDSKQPGLAYLRKYASCGVLCQAIGHGLLHLADVECWDLISRVCYNPEKDWCKISGIVKTG